MLTFAQHLAANKVWTEETWREAPFAYGTSMEAVDKCLKSVLLAHGFSLHEFIEKLQSSIAYEEEQSDKTRNAEQELLDAVRGQKLIIRGKQKNGNGNFEDVPLGFIDRVDYHIALWGNKFIPLTDNHNSTTHKQLQTIIDIGWHELLVKKDDVLKLWPQHPAIKKAVATKGKPRGVGKIDDTEALQKINAIIQEGKVRGVKTASESVAAELKIAERNRPATVDRWRRKYRAQLSGQ